MPILNQPERIKIGDVLIGILENNTANGFETFYVMSAYVKTSGVRRLDEAVKKFRAAGGKKVLAVTGIGQKNTSIQGLQALLSMCDEAWVYHNESRTRTFHPKVYAFERPKQTAIAFIGSSNLTGGGLFTNYEANYSRVYNLTNPLQAKRFDEVKEMFQFYSTPSEFCRKLTPELIEEIAEDYLSDETKQTPEEREEGTGTEEVSKPAKKKSFGTKHINPPPLPELSKLKPSLPALGPLAAFVKGAAKEVCDWSTKGKMRWSKKLSDRDCQITSSVSAPTGVLSLTQGELRGKINQTSYFRFDLFNGFIWKQARPAYNVETTDVAFCVRIDGKDRGMHRLTLRYNPKWESKQKNYTTALSWGELTKWVRDPSLVGKLVSIYDPPSGESEPYFLEVG